MQRSLKVFIICASLGAPAAFTSILYASVSNSNFGMMVKSERIRAQSQNAPTIQVELGVISPSNQGDGDGPAVSKAIQKLSSTLKQHKSSVNVEVGWAQNATSDSFPADVCYYEHSQLLEYSPNVLGTTFHYEGVTPAMLHTLASQRASNFHILKQWESRN